MHKKVLELKNVNVIFNKNTLNERQILYDINLDVYQGDFISIIGHNGSGKSTLLNLISGNTEIDSGTIILDGKDITNLPITKRTTYIRRVFQDPKHGTAPRMTVAENLMLAEMQQKMSLRLRSLKSKVPRYKTILEDLNSGLENFLESFTENLSGGQRQTLSFIMATMNNPQLLLLDEHTAALDPVSSLNMMNLTNKIVIEQKLTCFMITHAMQDAITYGNRLLVINCGKIIQDITKNQHPNLSVERLNQYFNKL